MANVLPHAMNLLMFGAGEPVKHFMGKKVYSWTNQTKAQVKHAAEDKVIDPKKRALLRDSLARTAAAATLGTGSSGRANTLFTGQAGVAGQAEVSVPSLLGR